MQGVKETYWYKKQGIFYSSKDGRHYIGYDVEKKYVNLSNQRINNYKTAVKKPAKPAAKETAKTKATSASKKK